MVIKVGPSPPADLAASFSRMHPWYREGKAGMRWSVTPPVSWLTFLVRQPRTWAEG